MVWQNALSVSRTKSKKQFSKFAKAQHNVKYITTNIKLCWLVATNIQLGWVALVGLVGLI